MFINFMKKGVMNNSKVFMSSDQSLLIVILLVVCLVIKSTIAEENNGRKLGVKVGVVVDYESWLGKMGLRSIDMAVSEFYASHADYRTRLLIHTRDSNNDEIGAAATALDLIKNVQVEAIIGPVKSTQAAFVVDLGEKAKVPVISYSATCSSLSIKSSYFFQVTQKQTSQAEAISSIVQAYGWKQVVPIYINNGYGEGLIPFLNDALQDVGCRMSYRSVISSSASHDQILKELYKLMTMQTRVFVVHTSISLGTEIFTKAKEIGMMEQGYVWIVTNVMSNFLSLLHSDVIDSMQGVIGIKTYVPGTNMLKGFKARWKNKFQQNNNPTTHDFVGLNVYGLWAYDSVQALAIAVENVYNNRKETSSLRNVTAFSANSTTGFQIGVSQNGPKLHKALSEVRFKGLAGGFRLVNGELQSKTFEIINVGKKVKRVGFWRPKSGLVKSLETNTSRNDTVLESVVWPGKSTIVPKGWEVATNRKKLRIGVPKKEYFKEFVAVKHDSATNNSIVTGYCIDVFEAAIKALPYNVDYDFIPFENPNGSSAGTYEDLVDQVYYKTFDAVVGDTTITAKRSKYVDFTLPYTESGVSMIVPLRDGRRKNAWVFVKPLTRDLWVTSVCFFIFIGFVVWVLEHRINDDFRGPPSYQIGTTFWFSFSTIIFAHIQRLQPTVTDVEQLIKNNERVGCKRGSFVHGVLLKSFGFNESQLQIYKSAEECDELFSKKKADGGIAAAFDEYPYMKLFFPKYCHKYTMVEPRFKTAGFGFVFPKGSPLVSDVSTAILTITEDKTMNSIEYKWFGSQTSCPDLNTQVSSNSLGLESFWGLFLIVGIASFSSLMIYVAMFFYQHRKILRSFDTDPKVSIWRRICIVMRVFNQKDSSSYTFENSLSGFRDKRAQDMVDVDVDVVDDEGSPNSSITTSPSQTAHI
ncbi:glutamate receptor 2.7-like isoform X2 [Humulus lupulus]|uniref:glutamate receptor 2.7-like isoform X2 n=1 Tax=Humulus lupulus TaxID=3486 RepID=UPI002B41345B|nr:glutamate receptor 2.7-like isoform X2 [Humulus lupulus]